MVTNNIIANNVAGWDGAGISLLDASVGQHHQQHRRLQRHHSVFRCPLQYAGNALASSTGPTCTSNCGTMSADQPAGLVVVGNSPQLTGVLPANSRVQVGLPGCRSSRFRFCITTCSGRTGHPHRRGQPRLGNAEPAERSFPLSTGSGGSVPAPSQPQPVASTSNGAGTIITGGTGACFTSPDVNDYWDIGVRGDTSASTHGSGLTLTPTYSVLTAGYTGNGNPNHNSNNNPTVVSQYCNGSRIPPELGSAGLPGTCGYLGCHRS